MKLWDTIELYGGGEGSGCNPAVAEPRCGRPSGSADTEVWKQTRDSVGKWHDGETDEESRARYNRTRAWDQSMLAALSLGKITIEEAKARGLMVNNGSESDFRPLPGTLFHVTTEAAIVETEGLKSRTEMDKGSGAGLGGGSSESISFTADIGVARDIRRAILEARSAINGKLTVEHMIALAKAGTGAKHPWLEETLKYNETAHGPLDNLLRQKREISSMFGDPSEVKKEPGNWAPVTSKYHWTGGDHVERYMYWERDMTKEELQDARFNFYKEWATFREEKGGPMYPLFFMTDTQKLASTKPENIQIMQFEPVPNAKGTIEHALGEWRTYTGKAVKLVRRVT